VSTLLGRRSHTVVAGSRRPAATPFDVKAVLTPDLGPHSDWSAVLERVDAVVHLAAKVHVMKATADDRSDFYKVNAEGTAQLASQAAVAGVTRFVLISSIKVHGEAGRFDEQSPLVGTDPYALSKIEAEAALWNAARGSRMTATVVRPPLVYGPGVRANFAELIRAVDRGVPLPLGAVRNHRSLIGVANLADAIVRCVEDSRAGGEAFLVSDGHDLSTADLIRHLATALGRPARLLPIPAAVLRAAGGLLNRRATIERLAGSLTADITKIKLALAWEPPVSVAEGLASTVAEHLSSSSAGD